MAMSFQPKFKPVNPCPPGFFATGRRGMYACLPDIGDPNAVFFTMTQTLGPVPEGWVSSVTLLCAFSPKAYAKVESGPHVEWLNFDPHAGGGVSKNTALAPPGYVPPGYIQNMLVFPNFNSNAPNASNALKAQPSLFLYSDDGKAIQISGYVHGLPAFKKLKIQKDASGFRLTMPPVDVKLPMLAGIDDEPTDEDFAAVGAPFFAPKPLQKPASHFRPAPRADGFTIHLLPNADILLGGRFELVGFGGDVVPQYAADGSPIWTRTADGKIIWQATPLGANPFTLRVWAGYDAEHGEAILPQQIFKMWNGFDLTPYVTFA